MGGAWKLYPTRSVSGLNVCEQHATWQLGHTFPHIRFGPPRPPVAILSPPCRLPVAVSALSAPCRSPVACLSLPCRCPAAPLSLPCRFPVAFLPPSCRYPVASCRFLSFPVAMLLFAWRLPVALLSLSCRSLLSLSCHYFLLPPCRPLVACLSSSCRLPVASLSPPCRLLDGLISFFVDFDFDFGFRDRLHIEAVPRTPWPGCGIQPVSGPLTPCTACSVP